MRAQIFIFFRRLCKKINKHATWQVCGGVGTRYLGTALQEAFLLCIALIF